eukprot:TRINITY_DN4145_c0_g1_i1.p1 TRINITY_DN4145_c0_g1~~TRINITY_DN4145_c0_g1_i1.p1  ORF type:complete len:754 (+),score=146.21 TRINITY_DN4145_c0_g1_i1:324-2585(+)
MDDYDSGENENFKVVIRVRPPLQRELNGDRPYIEVVKIGGSPGLPEVGKTVTIAEHLEGDDGSRGVLSSQTLTFDTVYDQTATQKTLYENTAKQAVLSVLQGYNATMIAYGQTGTGKTYTMEGFTNAEQRGIIPRATEEIFNYIQHCGHKQTKFLVRASYLQIYNEVISDLIKPNPQARLSIREDKLKGVYVDGLSEWIVRTPQEIYGLIDAGGKARAVGTTRMSEMSSRSHAIFTIICEQGECVEGDEEKRIQVRIGKLNIVDLAGSEKVRQTGATGQRLEESKKINWSLSALGKVISALTDSHGRQHVPYRDSKLTRILEDSLGGNCKTTMIAMISPAMESYQESLSTLKFANRAKNIKNEARINEDLDQRAELRAMEKELKRLRAALAEASKNVVETRRQLEVGEQCRLVEHEKIAELERNMLNGGQPIEDHPAFQQAIQKVNEEYNAKLEELDKERQAIEEDKQQVERYKQLLLKQRDIMIALTARLNERDETILALQEELDAYDYQYRLMEDALDQKTAAVLTLQRGGVLPSIATSDTDALHNRLAQREAELSTLREEKASIEYLLKHQLQQMVQQELEERMRAFQTQSDEWRLKCSSLEDENRRLQQALASDPRRAEGCWRCSQRGDDGRQASPGASRGRHPLDDVSNSRAGGRAQAGNNSKHTDEEFAYMQRHLDWLKQDRRAMKLIMEQKIKRRVDNIERLFHESLQQPGGPSAEGQKKVQEQLQALQLLLPAAIQALDHELPAQ